MKNAAKEAIAEQRQKGDKYSPESLRANMATGGGTPIPKGHKRTNEHRVLQPRDPDTGHFTYNADAELSLKYKSHGKADADPVSLRRFHLDKGVKKGDVVNIAGKTFYAIEDLDAEKIKDFLKRFDPDTGEFYSYGQTIAEYNAMPKKQQIEEAFTEIEGHVMANKFSDFFVKKKGRMSKAEKEGVEKGEGVVGHGNLSKVGKTVKKEIKEKKASIQKKFSPKWVDDKAASTIDPEVVMANMKFNEEYDAKQKAAKEAKMGMGGGSSGGPTGGSMGGAQQPKQQPQQPKQQPKPKNEAPKGEYSEQSAKRGIMPSGMSDANGNINPSAVDYNGNPDHKMYFDAWAEAIKANPAKFHFDPNKVGSITGQQLAYLAKKGAFKKVKF